MKKKKDIEEVLDEESKEALSPVEEVMLKEKGKAEKKEKIEEALEELEEAIKEEAKEKETEAIFSRLGKRPITVLLEDPRVEKHITKLREVAEVGLEETHKNIIVFYERATEAGERFRGLLFLLLGASIALTGSFVKSGHFITLTDILKVISKTWVGRMITVGIGISLMAYGSQRLFKGLLLSIKRSMFVEEKPKYIQKKLVE